jgi:hypothetical protein
MRSEAIHAMRLPAQLKTAIDNYCDALLDMDRQKFDSEPYKAAFQKCDELWNAVQIAYGVAVRSATGSTVPHGVQRTDGGQP